MIMISAHAWGIKPNNPVVRCHGDLAKLVTPALLPILIIFYLQHIFANVINSNPVIKHTNSSIYRHCSDKESQSFFVYIQIEEISLDKQSSNGFFLSL
jgi:hypothetical protein